MEENMNKIEELLEKIHISLYNFNRKNGELEDRIFLEVINDLARSWETLNDDYKGELYEAMGIVPSKPKASLDYPVGVRAPFKHPSDASNPHITCTKGTGIEYLKNQPTCCEVK